MIAQLSVLLLHGLTLPLSLLLIAMLSRCFEAGCSDHHY